jgi:hypothetical protein
VEVPLEGDEGVAGGGDVLGVDFGFLGDAESHRNGRSFDLGGRSFGLLVRFFGLGDRLNNPGFRLIELFHC